MTNLTSLSNPSNSNAEIIVMQYHNIVAARVLDRHNLTQDQLAREAQVHPSHLSRMLCGQRTLSPEVLRALWKLTHDPELLDAITGETGTIYIHEASNDDQSQSQSQPQTQQRTSSCVVALSYMLNQCHTPINSDDDRARRVADIDKTMNALASMRSSVLQSPLPPSTQSTRQTQDHRTVQHTTGHTTGRMLDHVA